jgi:hypothetical protein
MNGTSETGLQNGYMELRIMVRPKLAEAFKAACAKNGTYMDFVLLGYMESYSNALTPKKTYSPDLSKKSQRRAAVSRILEQLGAIRDNEENYKNRIPDNLMGSEAYELAEQSVDIIDEAVDVLEMAY